jgi:hypothetical protein
MIEGASTNLEARRHYVARVEDVFRDREFHGVLGKEYIDGEVHYLVDWVPTLVRGRVLHKAKVQPLISQFEASCEAQGEEEAPRGLPIERIWSHRWDTKETSRPAQGHAMRSLGTYQTQIAEGQRVAPEIAAAPCLCSHVRLTSTFPDIRRACRCSTAANLTC